MVKTYTHFQQVVTTIFIYSFVPFFFSFTISLPTNLQTKMSQRPYFQSFYKEVSTPGLPGTNYYSIFVITGSIVDAVSFTCRVLKADNQ